MNQYHAQIYITLRPSVLDPAGTAVRSGLHQLGFERVGDVRIGKYVELSVAAEDPQKARQQIDQMCDRLLANPVIENYRIELVNGR
ncbi:MAG: phosphoribosylformylglycinamidine synthase subunit PurS [Elainellaceae cyanobacterium]